MPARIFDDIAVCGLRGRYTLERVRASADPRMELEKREGEIEVGERRQMEVFIDTGEWVRIVGIPDAVVDNLVVEFTITRQYIRHIIPRAVVYAYMCMSGGEGCATLIAPTTPGEEVGYLVVPNGRFLEYLAQELGKVIRGEVEGGRNPFCPSCLYRNICPYSM